jgi:hypothetical protein
MPVPPFSCFLIKTKPPFATERRKNKRKERKGTTLAELVTLDRGGNNFCDS